MMVCNIPTKFSVYWEGLSDEELGRLVRGLLRYAGTNEEPELPGNEKILWPVLKEQTLIYNEDD